MLNKNGLNYKDWITAFILFILTILLSLHYYLLLLLNVDEGIALYGAKRILMGQTLYKDFFDIVTPGTDYLLALIFKLFGTTLKAARLSIIITNSLNVVMLLIISRKLIKGRKLAYIPPVLLMLSYISDLDYGAVSHHAFAIFFATLTLFLLMLFDNNKALKWLLAGLGTSLTLLFLQSTGLALYGILSLYFVIRIVLNLIKRKKSSIHFTTLKGLSVYDREIPSNPNLFPTEFILFSLSFWLPIIATLIFFMIKGGLHNFIYDIFIWPAGHYVVTNNVSFTHFLHFPSIYEFIGLKRLPVSIIDVLFVSLGVIIYFPIMLFFVGAIYIIQQYWKNKIFEDKFLFLLLILSTLFISEYINPSSLRLLLYFPFFLVLVFFIVQHSDRGFAGYILKTISLCYLIGTVALSYNWYQKTYNYVISDMPSIEVKTAAGKIILPDTSADSIDSLLKIKFPRYSFILFWSPSIYFITGTNNPTVLNTYTPVYNTRAQANKVIEQLEYFKPKLVIIDGYLNDLKQARWRNVNPEVFNIKNDPLLNYISHNYKISRKIDDFYYIYELR
ncbi:MAG: glycosyltransferase family 39 protein [Deltaproteobacteria bacterium]|nr:glycosyltransferase family 39 protein [Deltaproteobacteria bacterium]